MNLTRSGQIAVGLIAFGVISSVWGWEPREPAGATPLNAEQIKAAFAGKIANGRDIAFVDHHFKDGRFKGVTDDGRPYGGKWWVEEKDNYICFKYSSTLRECWNIARGEDGNYYYYKWGSDLPDAFATLEPMSD